MCHSNLDFRQQAISRRAAPPIELPILFLTELAGLALGLAPRALGLHRHFVSPRSVLELATAPKSLPEKPKSLPDRREQI
jgi:heterodisulfide reductase subunit B